MARTLRIAVDLRALVPEHPTGIGTYVLALLRELARSERLRFLGLSHVPVRRDGELRAAGVELEHDRTRPGVLCSSCVSRGDWRAATATSTGRRSSPFRRGSRCPASRPSTT